LNARELQQYLHDRIPLSRAMAVEVRAADADTVTVYAPLAPNINHRDTVFGGSASAVAILAAWSVLRVRLATKGVESRIVIRRNTMSYERPITAGFTATATAPDHESWQKLVATLQRGRAARARVHARLECDGELVGELQGEFALLPPA